ncbi:hypothetical protein [Lacticaseibacillus hegangensis]|uniref:Antitoxin n=1 Tax=Lacticaseibacillus hegangensis TaxID=2486010 RepID=A0ABW4CUL7_9LACO|nr:hypothetical protein [Lacticaseibacillus hegangensis]
MRENYTPEEAKDNFLTILDEINEDHKVVHVSGPAEERRGVRIMCDADYCTLVKTLYLAWYGAKGKEPNWQTDPQYEDTVAKLKIIASREQWHR